MDFQFAKRQKFYILIKNIIDFFGAFIGILFCIALLWIWVLPINFFVTKGHPFFVQERVGKNKKIFKMLKFRTMKVSSSEIPPNKLSSDMQKEMCTKFGLFLRKSSIDETLQLFNILVGQMSFVGPRPGAAKNEDDLIKARENEIPSAFLVRPGLTGFAQIKNRTSENVHNPYIKAKFDSFYVKNISPKFDIELFVKTFFSNKDTTLKK